MSDDQLIRVLDALKGEPWKFTHRVIGHGVIYSTCNTNEILNIAQETCFESFFVIKNEYAEIVGCVYDMKYDLHWLILRQFRGNGYLRSALRNAILPFIFKHLHRTKQTIRILAPENNAFYKKSSKVARCVGFRRVSRKTTIIQGVGEYHHFSVTGKNFFSKFCKIVDNN